ncbi:hypothetical protein EAH89_25535 [Roseomonas nepalensis]|uniref:Toxin-antitoxin system HicB family antitoxin n=1 Tax=Muricoccus nepalensis TaxID=1854500 RepID=A0A502F9B7_9PROT|nr:hypothetical protein EAH89_25535 [Roseomonas nepalensis]
MVIERPRRRRAEPSRPLQLEAQISFRVPADVRDAVERRFADRGLGLSAGLRLLLADVVAGRLNWPPSGEGKRK